MAKTASVTVCVPSWAEFNSGEKSGTEAFSVALIGATESIDGGTYIKKNDIPTNSDDYDVMCDGCGNLNGEYPLIDVTSIYIWGYGFTLNGSYYDCEPFYDEATEIEIAQDTEIILWGANSTIARR